MSIDSGYFDLASDLSSRLVNVESETVDDEIANALRRIMDFFGADFCTIFKVIGRIESRERVRLVHAMHAGKAISSVMALDPQELIPGLIHEVLGKKNGMCVRVPNDLPGPPDFHRSRLAHFGIESLVLAPITAGASGSYLFALGSTCLKHAWSPAQLAQFRMLAEMLVGAIFRRSMHESLQRAARDLADAQRICRFGRWEWEVQSGMIMNMDAVEKILGVAPDTQATLMELVHPTDRAAVQKAIESALSQNEGGRVVEYRIHTRRDDLRIVRSRFEAVHSKNGPHVIGTFHDVTDLRRGEQELQLLRSRYWHADRVARTGILVASLAHELSQPLAAILTNAQAGLRFLSRLPLDKQEIQGILEDIIEDNRRARSIIDALRAMIRGNKTKREKVDVNIMAREVLSLLHSEFVVQQVEVELACAGDCVVTADKTQIEQVLLNLVLNSIDSMRNQPADQRRLRIQVNCVGKDEVQVAVRDCGVGLAKEQIESVFEAFWTTKSHGLGMGLAVCRSIVEAHGGRIWAESNDGHGATFLFRLPVEAKGESPMEPRETQ